MGLETSASLLNLSVVWNAPAGFSFHDDHDDPIYSGLNNDVMPHSRIMSGRRIPNVVDQPR